MVEFFNYEKPKPVNKLQDVGMSALSGLGKTASGILSAPEELFNLGKLGVNKVRGLLNPDANIQFQRTDIPLLPSFQQMEEKRMKDPILSYEPQTKFGEFANTIAEFGGGGRLFGKIPGRVGAGAGAVKESTEGFLGEGGSTALALGLDLGLNAIFSMRNPAHILSLKQSIKNLKSQGKLDEAQKLIDKANDIGVNLSAPEAIAEVSGDKTILGALDAIGKSEGGMSVVNNFTKDRFSQLSGANLKYLNDMFPDFDASKVDTGAFTNKFVNTLIDQSDNISKAINQKARTLKKGGWAKFESDTDLGMAGQTYLDMLNASVKNETKANRIHYNNIANFLRTPNGNISNVNLQEAYNYAVKQSKNAELDGSTKLIYQSQAKNIKGILDSNEYFARASEFTKRANEKFAETFRTLSVGQDDITKVTNPNFTLLENVLFDPKNVDPINIIRLNKELNKIDKTLFPELAGLVMNKKINAIIKATPSDMVGKNIFEMYMGKGQKPLTLQMIKGVAISQGKDPKKAIKGFEDLMQVFEASANLPGAGSQTMPRAQFQKSLENLGIFDLDPANLGIFEKIRTKVGEMRAEELAEMFFSPNAIEKMINLGSNKKKYANTVLDILNDASREFAEVDTKTKEKEQNQQQELINLKEYQ